MTPDEIIARLSDTKQARKFPKTALEQARLQWEEVYPHIQRLMQTFCATETLSEGESQCLFFGLHLLGDRKETRALEDLLELCNRDDDFGSPLDQLMGDTMTERLSTLFFLLCEQKADALFTFISSSNGGEWVKLAALRSIFSLVESGHLDTNDITPKLAKWISQFEQKRQSTLLTNLATYCITYQLDQAKGLFQKLFREHKLEPGIINNQELQNWQLHRPVKDIAEGHVKSDYDIMEMATWASFSEPEPRRKRNAEPLRTYNPETDKPKAGRNDPCPCGSGKKHKKCCLN